MSQNNISKSVSCIQRIAHMRPYALPSSDPCIDVSLSGTERPLANPVLNSLQPSTETMSSYPNAHALEHALAKTLHVSEEHVFVSAGADESLDRICRALLEPGSQLVTLEPTFEMIGHYARLAGADVVKVTHLEKGFPLQAVCDAVNAHTRIVAVVTPNNPTGQVATEQDIRTLSQHAPHALIVLDMAYGEFASSDLTFLAIQLPNVVAVRTFSKAWGAPGIRVGYAVSQPQIIHGLRTCGGPYAVTSVSLNTAQELLEKGTQNTGAYVQKVQQERTQMREVLRSYHVESLPTESNFLWVSPPNRTWWDNGLRCLGISTKKFSAAHLEAYRRITCPGDDVLFQKVLHAIHTLYAPEGLLLDMDGVLADVSHSYRQAVIETAAHYGVTLTYEDVAKAKDEGGANNDWEVTQRLMQRRGVDVGLKEVTHTFETLYQGTSTQPGLRSTERMIVPQTCLEALAQRYPVAVVTGRPRKDAVRFVEEHGLQPFIKTMVCMEDGPLKPRPEPVQKALQQLGITRAWMVGDTPDDIHAARKAGVLGIGVTAPADNPEATQESLFKWGAACVLPTLEYLAEVLP
jgi:histidinol-phosphate aminotransferase